jgi:hypothetical protein
LVSTSGHQITGPNRTFKHYIQRHDIIQKLEELSEGLELAVLGLIEILKLLLESLRERIVELGECGLR